jgi:RHS repeat-associated protein
MPWGLKRFHASGQTRFVTFSYYHGLPCLHNRRSQASVRGRAGVLKSRTSRNRVPAEYFVGGRDWGTLSTGGVNFRYPDWVGNGRVWQDVAGTVTQQAAYAAFGDGLFAPGGGSCCSLQAGMFDSAWQDSANNTYHTLYREYSPTQGRWLTPDPAGLAVMDITNPQTWNRYAYVSNNPLSNIDPTGLACYPLEKQMFGSCAPFMNNGVNFGGNWNEFDLFNIPVTTQTYTPAQPISTPINSINNQYGYAVSATLYIPGAWSNTVVGNGWDLFGGIGTAIAGVLPPGMNGALQAAKQATRGLPKVTPNPPVSPGNWQPPQTIEDLIEQESKAWKFIFDNFPPSGMPFPVMVNPCITNPYILPSCQPGGGGT